MDVFISWSGRRSRHIAWTLHGWLRDLIHFVEPWMSERDIDAGARWSPAIGAQLEKSKFGIIVVTPENVAMPWLNFEAGALAKSLDEGRVCPYLFDMEPRDLPAGPLTQFQAKQSNREGTLELVRTINSAVGESALEADRLDRAFARLWPELEAAILQTPVADEATAPRRSTDDILEEILSIVRRLDKPPRGPVSLSELEDEEDRRFRDALYRLPRTEREFLERVRMMGGRMDFSQRPGASEDRNETAREEGVSGGELAQE